MSLRIFNDHSANLSAAIAFYSPDICGGEGKNFEIRGWWNIAPHSSAVVFGGDCDFNRFWYCFAQASDGRKWTGPFNHSLPHEAFDTCWGIANTQQTIAGHFFQFDTGGADNVNLHLT